MVLNSDGIIMAKQKVAQPKPSHNNTEAQLGGNLTSMTVSSQIHELKTSGIVDCDATTNSPPTGGVPAAI